MSLHTDRPFTASHSVEESCSEKSDLLIQKALEAGAEEALMIPVETVMTASWVEWKCRYGCEDYGKSLTCPPHAPSYHKTRELLEEYSLALLFKTERSYLVRYLAYALEKEAFLMGYSKAFGMGAGPCKLCESCDVSSPCLRPREARPSMEACGIDVFSTVRRNGMRLHPLKSKDDRQQSFGLILVE